MRGILQYMSMEGENAICRAAKLLEFSSSGVSMILHVADRVHDQEVFGKNQEGKLFGTSCSPTWPS